MARQKKEYRAMSLKMEKEADEKIMEIVNETGMSQTAVIQNAVKMYYQYYKETGRL